MIYTLIEDVKKGEELKEYISPDKKMSFLMVKRQSWIRATEPRYMDEDK